MADIYGYFNIRWAGRTRFNGVLGGFCRIQELNNIDLQNFGMQTININPPELSHYFDLKGILDNYAVGSTVDYELPSHYHIRIEKSNEYTATINLCDNNLTIIATFYTGIENTYFTFQRFNRVNSTNSYIAPATIYYAGSSWYVDLIRPRDEYQSAFNFPWITTEDPLGTAPILDAGEGGYGEFDYSSDDDTFPGLPTTSLTKAGFVNLFKLDETGIESLANYLWSGLFDMATYLKLFSDPMDCILSLGLVPVDPAASEPLYIVVGNHATTVQAPRISSNWYELDCGSITLEGTKYSNSFMDYSPYSKAELYLPYVGTVSLDIDEIMDSTIAIKYHIDLLSGSCVAYVKVTKNYNYKGATHTHSNIMYQFSGNVLMNIPITSQNFTQVLQAVIGAVAVGVSGGASGAVTAGSGEAAGAMTGEHAAAAIGATAQMKPAVSRSGNCSSACGILGTQKPKLMLTMPKIAYAEDMNKERGYPTYMRKTLSSLNGSGFCKIDLAHLKGIPCTDSERDEIIRLLESGVEL